MIKYNRLEQSVHNEYLHYDDQQKLSSSAKRRRRVNELKKLIGISDLISVDSQGNYHVIFTKTRNPVTLTINRRGYIIGMIERIDKHLIPASAGPGRSFEIYSLPLFDLLNKISIQALHPR